jgi:hypothetical protein
LGKDNSSKNEKKKIYGNTAPSILYISGDGTSIVNCSFEDNTITTKGVIYCENVVNTTINTSKFINNSNYYFNLKNSTVNISDSIILKADSNIFKLDDNLNVVTANDNWWGSNDKPVIDGVTIERWVIMSVTPESATADEEVTITATFDKTNSTAGVIADYAGNLPADVLNVTFTSTSGNLNEVKAVKDKQASVTYTPARTDEKLTVTSTNAVVEIPVEVIKPDVVYVSKTGIDTNDGETKETAVASLAQAYDLVADNGKIVILNDIEVTDVLIVTKDLEIAGENDASINTYLNNNNDTFVKLEDIATTSDTTNKLVIGNGYYTNVIGDNIQDALYLNKPTIKSTIQFIQNNARSKLTLLWTNDDPSNTWDEWNENSGDLSDPSENVRDHLSITLTDTYLGYIMLVKSYLGDNTLHPIVFYNLPVTITNNMTAVSSNYPSVYGKKIKMYTHPDDSGFFDVTLYIGIDISNPNNILVYRNIEEYASSSVFNNKNYMIPMQLYGWRI